MKNIYTYFTIVGFTALYLYPFKAISQSRPSITGPDEVCIGDVVSYFTTPSERGNSLSWSVGSEGVILKSGNSAIVQWHNTGITTLRVEEKDFFGNLASQETLNVSITAPPSNFIASTAIIGASSVCINEDHIYKLRNSDKTDWRVTAPDSTISSYSNLSTLALKFSLSGTYIIECKDKFLAPSPFFVTVHPKPAKPTSIYGPTEVCKLTPISYIASPHISGTTFQWSVSSGNVNPQEGMETNITFNTLPATIDVVRVTTDGSGCKSEPFTQAIETVMPSVSILTNAPNEICGSTQWNFETDYVDGDLYHWKILSPEMGSIVSGNYTPEVEIQFNNPTGTSENVAVIVAVTKCGSVKRDTLIVQVRNAPAYTATSSATTICANEPVNFTISPTPEGYSSLYWDFGDGVSSNSLTPSYTFTGNTDIAEYTPTVTIVNPEGCLSTVVIPTDPIMIKPAPVAHISPGDIVGCGPFSQELTATISTGISSTANIKWYGPSGSNPPAPNCQTCDTWTVDQYGTYYIEVENSLGCTTLSKNLIVVENCDDCQGPKPIVLSQDSSFKNCAKFKPTLTTIQMD